MSLTRGNVTATPFDRICSRRDAFALARGRTAVLVTPARVSGDG
jgi:hypothetical protein